MYYNGKFSPEEKTRKNECDDKEQWRTAKIEFNRRKGEGWWVNDLCRTIKLAKRQIHILFWSERAHIVLMRHEITYVRQICSLNTEECHLLFKNSNIFRDFFLQYIERENMASSTACVCTRKRLNKSCEASHYSLYAGILEGLATPIRDKWVNSWH